MHFQPQDWKSKFTDKLKDNAIGPIRFLHLRAKDRQPRRPLKRKYIPEPYLSASRQYLTEMLRKG